MHQFRIYDKTGKRMIYPEELAKMGVLLAPTGIVVQLKGDQVLAQLQNVIAMHDTGMYTKKGQKIWSGDIVKIHVPNEFGSVTEYVGEMKYINGKFEVYVPSNTVKEFECQVIIVDILGNMIENEDILKQYEQK